MATDVFLSVGRAYTPQQESFVSELETILRTAGLNPRTVGRSDFSSSAPLKRIAGVLNECQGTVVLAFERSRSATYIDRPNSALEAASNDVRLPTVWNQIEAAMSYVKDKPLLVVVEQGLRDEGLLEDRYDWYVQRIPLSDAALRSIEFRAVLDDWIGRVKSQPGPTPETPPAADVTKLTLKEILGAMTVTQVWGIAAAVVSVFVVVATIAYRLGAAAG